MPASSPRIKSTWALSFGFGFVMLILVGWAISNSANQFVKTGDEVVRANRILIVLHELDRTLTRAESEQRGYLITDRANFLKSFGRVGSEMEREFQVLSKLGRNDAATKRDFTEAQTAAVQKIAEMQRVLQMRKTQGLLPARREVAASRGIVLMSRFQAAIGRMEAREKTFLQNIDRRNRTNRDEARTYLFTGLGFAVLAVLISMILVARDTQRRVVAEERLERSVSLQQAIFDSVNAAIFAFEPDGRLTTFNLTAERWLGYTAEQVIGQMTPLAFHDRDELYQSARERQVSGTDLSILLAGTREREREERRWTLVRADGTRFPAIVSYSVLRGSLGEAVGFVGVATDLTEIEEARRSLDEYVAQLEHAQKALETQNRRLEVAADELKESRDVALLATRLKSEFLANMSHEIRTPMNGVLGMAHLLQQTGLSDRQRQFVRTIQQSAEGLLTVLNDILDLSKMEAGKMSLDYFPFDLREALEDLVETIAPTAHQKGIELGLDIPPRAPHAVVGDAGRLRQVLMNLLSNAVKFTEKGEVFLRVRVTSESPGRARFRFTVCDTGIGIPSDHQTHIFESFTQADGSTTRRFGGTGLGLTISRQLIDLMGGEIGVTSEVGKGSEFWAELSLAVQPGTTASDHTNELVGRRVLVVDDNATNRSVLREILQDWGCQVTECEDGAEAIQAVQAVTTPFDAVIVDMNMPQMDGAQTAAEIRRHPPASTTGLILLSSIGYLPDNVSDRPLFDAILSKPVRNGPLFDSLRFVTGGIPAPIEEAPAIPREQLPRLSVLVVEDNPVNQLVAAEMLRHWGLEVTTADNGVAAVEQIRHGRVFDVVLMDIQMPVLDGLQATQEIRRHESIRGGHIPIIAMTANAMTGDEERCLKAGMDGYLSKPLQPKDLFLKIATLAGEVSDPRPAPSISTGDAPILDLHRFDEACGGKAVLKRKVAERYLAGSRKTLEELKSAATANDAAAVASAAHSLKGSSLTIGSELVGRLCETMERKGREGIIDESDIQTLERHLNDLHAALREILRVLEEAVR